VLAKSFVKLGLVSAEEAEKAILWLSDRQEAIRRERADLQKAERIALARTLLPPEAEELIRLKEEVESARKLLGEAEKRLIAALKTSSYKKESSPPGYDYYDQGSTTWEAPDLKFLHPGDEVEGRTFYFDYYIEED